MMMNVSVDQIKERIVEEKGIDVEEVNTKISKKLEELSGLISEEGAAHIVANEYGVDLLKKEGSVKIKDLMPGMKGVEFKGRIVRKYDLRTFEKQEGQGKVAKALVGDETGVTMLVFWDDKTEYFEKLNDNDIILVTKADIRDNNGRSEAHVSRDGEVQINPEGVEVEQKSFEKQELTKKKISELTENDNNAEIFVTIVQVFDPKFFQMKSGDEGAVLNLFVDDGSDNIRTVFWKDQLVKLSGKSFDELKKVKDDPSSFEDVKTDLLGRMVKLIGRVQNNQMFNRLEFIVNDLELDVDPDKESANLEKSSEKEPVKEPVSKKESADEEIDDLDDDIMSLEDIDED